MLQNVKYKNLPESSSHSSSGKALYALFTDVKVCSGPLGWKLWIGPRHFISSNSNQKKIQKQRMSVLNVTPDAHQQTTGISTACDFKG